MESRIISYTPTEINDCASQIIEMSCEYTGSSISLYLESDLIASTNHYSYIAKSEDTGKSFQWVVGDYEAVALVSCSVAPLTSYIIPSEYIRELGEVITFSQMYVSVPGGIVEWFIDGVLTHTGTRFSYTLVEEDQGKIITSVYTNNGVQSDVTSIPIQIANLPVYQIKIVSTNHEFRIPLNDGGATLTYLQEPTYKVFNQFSQKLANGESVSYEQSPFIICLNNLLIQSVPRDVAESFRDFVHDVLHLSEEEFTLSLERNCGNEVNFGLGFEKNPVVEGCQLVGSTTNNMFKFKEPGVYDLKISYEFLKES